MNCKLYNIITFMIIITKIHNCNFLKINFVQINVIIMVNEKEYGLIL